MVYSPLSAGPQRPAVQWWTRRESNPDPHHFTFIFVHVRGQEIAALRQPLGQLGAALQVQPVFGLRPLGYMGFYPSGRLSRSGEGDVSVVVGNCWMLSLVKAARAPPARR
jgi:hypothetical protein